MERGRERGVRRRGKNERGGKEKEMRRREQERSHGVYSQESVSVREYAHEWK